MAGPVSNRATSPPPRTPPDSVEVWDSGLNDGGWNAAFDQGWLAQHADGERPDLLRFHRSRPAACIGRHQALEREIRLDYCRQHGIEIMRRISGGGALYLDQNQQGISLIFRRPADWAGLGLAQLLARFCAALAGGLAHLGIPARFKTPNDLEIDGRKLTSAILAQASIMLLPYCAKPAWCEWRYLDDCTECGKCEVGDAYRLARERNMQVTTITGYEHLTATLGRMKRDGVAAYVGACCGQFFIKRHHAFREAGMAAVLMDISGANCYVLRAEAGRIGLCRPIRGGSAARRRYPGTGDETGAATARLFN